MRFGPTFPQVRALVAALGLCLAAPALAQDADEAELLNHFQSVDVWHFPVAYDVGYNNQDAVVTRELVALPPPSGKLCYIRFDLLEGKGDYSYGFRPGAAQSQGPETAWGVYVHNRGTVTNQLRSVLKLNAIYFYVDGPKQAGAADICAQKQSAATAKAGHGYTAPQWSDLVVRAKLVHGWPQTAEP
jgi:hypothetical protein